MALWWSEEGGGRFLVSEVPLWGGGWNWMTTGELDCHPGNSSFEKTNLHKV